MAGDDGNSGGGAAAAAVSARARDQLGVLPVGDGRGSDLQRAIIRKEQVREFEVAVHHKVGVEVCGRKQQLLREALDLRQREGCRHRVNEARDLRAGLGPMGTSPCGPELDVAGRVDGSGPTHIVLQALEDQEYRVNRRADNHLEQLDDVWVLLQRAQDANFAQVRDWHAFAVE